MKVSKALVESLLSEGIEHYFTVYAEHIMSLIIDSELSKLLKPINATHEPGAGFMGIGYSRVSNKAGVCVFTGGPGVLNAVNPIASAYIEADPLIIIASTPPRDIAYKNALHVFPNDTDQFNVFRSITKKQFRITSPEQTPQVISKAFNEALSNRPGPVYVEIPADMFDSIIDEFNYVRIQPSKPTPSDDVIKEVLRMLSTSKKPVILAGRGVTIAEAENELIAVAEFFDVPVCTTVVGKGVIPPTHPLYGGIAAGSLGDPVADELLSNADLVLAIGVKFSQMGTGRYSMKINGDLIHVNVEADDMNRVFKATIAIKADAKEFLSKLLTIAKRESTEKIYRGSKELVSKLWDRFKTSLVQSPRKGDLIESWEVIEALRSVFDEDTIYVCDVGAHRIDTYTMPAYKPRTYIASASYASMGRGVPGAIGAKLAKKDSNVVGLVGDGGFLMTGLEVITGVRYNVPVIIVVFNDSAYRVLGIYEKVKYGSEFTYRLPHVNFCELSKSLGAHGIRVERREDLRNSIEEALSLAKDKPVVVDVVVNPETIPIPMRRLYKANYISELNRK
jgi:acetolactate synthase-1/2/3 large subunit